MPYSAISWSKEKTNHAIYKAKSCASPGDSNSKLVGPSSDRGGRTDSAKTPTKCEVKPGATCGRSLGRGLLGMVGAPCLHSPASLLSQRYAPRSSLWLSNSRQLHSPHLLFQQRPVAMTEPLLLYPLTRFEVLNPLRVACNVAVSGSQNDSKNSEQGLRNGRPNRSTSVPKKERVCDSEPTPLLPAGEEASAVSVDPFSGKSYDGKRNSLSGSASDDIMRGGRSEDIHDGRDNIHGSCSGVHESADGIHEPHDGAARTDHLDCDLRFEQELLSETESSLTSSCSDSSSDSNPAYSSSDSNPASDSSSASSSADFGSTPPCFVPLARPAVPENADQAHLRVCDTFRLKKLLSDESGYYESNSSDAATSPSDWLGGEGGAWSRMCGDSTPQVVMECDEMEDYEWDEEDDTGECMGSRVRGVCVCVCVKIQNVCPVFLSLEGASVVACCDRECLS